MGKAVCFIGHRDTEDTAEMRATIIDLLINLIIQEDATDFLFGSRSTFNDICYEIVTQMSLQTSCIMDMYSITQNKRFFSILFFGITLFGHI